VIAAKGTGEQVRGYLDEFLSRVRLSDVKPTVSSGHLTKCRASDAPLYRGRVLVVGDAAGLLDPWSREGISFALRSGAAAGQAAAQAAQAADGDEAARAFAGYADTITSTLGPEMQAGQAFMRAFKRHPLAMHLALILVPQAWDLFADVISGRVSIASITKRRPIRVLLAVLSA
jgi:flavin-dependent dehydrogenase